MENEVFLNLKGIMDSVSRKPGEKRLSLLVAKKVYEDCLNADVHSDVIMKMSWRKLFTSEGPFPWLLLNDGDDEETNQDHVIKMMSSTLFYGGNPFFRETYVEQETVSPGNKSRWNIHFSIGNIQELISIHQEADEYEEANYRLNKSNLAMPVILVDAGLDLDELKDFVPDILQFQKSLIKVAADAINFRNKLYEKNPHLRDEHHTYACQDLDHQMKHIKWCAIAKQILANYGLQANSKIGITINDPMDYVKAVDKLLSETHERVIINYLAIKFIMKHLKYMHTPLRDIYYDDLQHSPRESSLTVLSSRWQQCVEVVSDFLCLPLEKEYLKETLDEGKRAKVSHMIKKLKEAHISLSDKMTWMHTVLPGAEMKEMLKKINTVFGNSVNRVFENVKVLDRFIQETSIPTLLSEESSTLIEDVLELKRLRRRAKVSADERVSFFSGYPKFSIFKRIIFPSEIDMYYGELAFPVFLPGRPMYMEYGALGARMFTFISYLLIRAVTSFPNNEKAVVPYIDAGNCLIDQHYLLKMGKTPFKVVTDEESQNIIELLNAIGALGSFEAYKKYLDENGEEKGLPGLPFTNQQLFFIWNAQTQCEKLTEDSYANYPSELVLPARYRVNVPFANSKDFAQAFRCPVGSSMNPKQKCCLLGNGKSSQKCE